MKTLTKKLVAALLVASMSFTTIYGTVLYQERSEQTITRGVSHINDKLLMTDGWRNVNILKIDLDDSNVSVRPIEAANGTQRQTVLQMVTNSGAVAGVNADYFDMGSSNTPSLGMLIADNKLRHGYNSNYYTLGPNKNMATFMIDNSNTPSMAYYGVSIRINSNGNLIGAASGKNNISSSITRPVVVDSTYLATTNSIVSAHPTVYTIVVQNNVVTYMTRSGEGVTIPKDGFVIVVPQSMANEYYSKLSVGSNLEVEETIFVKDGLVQAVNNMKLGIGGSGIIMRNGEAYTGPAHSVTPNAKVARTIVATIKGTNEILLMTVDKSGSFVGANKNDLIELLKRYHVQDAMYFDGGGSTTFVSRDQGSFTPTLQNKPTEGSQRKVINGLGVFTTSQTGSVANLIFSTGSDRSFVGHKVNLYVKGTDENYNPVSVDMATVQYSVSGITGEFSGSTFTPTSAGTGIITATLGGASAQYPITVTERPTGLVIDPSYVQVSTNGTQAVNVYGVDRDGYKILLNASEVSWTSNNDHISANNNTIVAHGTSGLARLTATYRGATGTVGVVAGNQNIPLESFENNTAKFAGNIGSVSGNIFPISDIKYHGAKSLKMTYTFKASSEKQVAYAVLNAPVTIPSDASSINMWLYGKNQGHGVKVQITDANNEVYTLNLADSINFNGWKYVSAAIPENIALPAKMTKVNVYANTVAKTTTSAVYMDHISVTRGFRNNVGITAKADYLADAFYKETLQEAIGGQYIINAVGPTRADSMQLNDQNISAISKQLSSGASLVIKASQKNSQLNLTANNDTYANTYKVNNCGNTKVIMLGTGTGSIRTTDKNGWINLQASVEQSVGMKNLIIVTSVNPLTQFTDSLEGQAFHNYLKEIKKTTGQNIFVVYAGGKQPEVRIEDGIRYIRTNGISTVNDNYQDGSFIKFKVDGDMIYYTIEKFK